MFGRLDPALIIDTARRLAERVGERFPDSGLHHLAGDLVAVSETARADLGWLRAPHWPLRTAMAASIALLLTVFAATLAVVFRLDASATIADVIQAIDAGINEIVLLGVAVYFLSGLEARWKRNRALRAIHVLRSMAHIIDMHQLTKDPERVINPSSGVDTPSSPKRAMTPFLLSRYLDYCSEMLSMLSKSAALYVQDFNDANTLAAVNEVEDLTSGLASKIWQKIMILDRQLADTASGGKE